MDDTLKSVKLGLTFAGGVLVVAVLYWAQAVLVPFALAILPELRMAVGRWAPPALANESSQTLLDAGASRRLSVDREPQLLWRPPREAASSNHRHRGRRRPRGTTAFHWSWVGLNQPLSLLSRDQQDDSGDFTSTAPIIGVGRSSWSSAKPRVNRGRGGSPVGWHRRRGLVPRRVSGRHHGVVVAHPRRPTGRAGPLASP